jgi:hypothetical protein
LDLSTDLVVFAAVLALRLVVPLWIPKVPLPAIIACLGIDGVDQTIFQRWTGIDLTGYQSYDKALDVYYLTIAYLSTMRNWDNTVAFNASRFLLYYRLVGVMLFEFLSARALLMIFPNTFEYFFIFVEAVRTRWRSARMSRSLVLGAAAAIWIVIKLPQEYWIHIAQRDVTDELAAHPEAVPILIGIGALVLAAAWWVLTRKAPAPDHRFQLVVADPFGDAELRRRVAALDTGRLFDLALLEKVALTTLVTVIFSQILPDVQSTPLQLAIGVGTLVVANTAVSEWLVRRGTGWETAARQFVAMGLINAGLVVAADLLLPIRNGDIRLGNTLFFVLLITLLVTLFDRYRPIYVAREQARWDLLRRVPVTRST